MLIPCIVVAASCNSEIYLRDGVTDGDTFEVSPYAAANPDPVVQSWIRYSVARSVCQLEADGDNPARADSFACESAARRHLVDAWRAHRQAAATAEDAYLDALSRIESAGYLDEYVAGELARADWSLPDDLAMSDYRRWRRAHLSGHRPQTRIVGAWYYRNGGGTP